MHFGSVHAESYRECADKRLDVEGERHTRTLPPNLLFERLHALSRIISLARLTLSSSKPAKMVDFPLPDSSPRRVGGQRLAGFRGVARRTLAHARADSESRPTGQAVPAASPKPRKTPKRPRKGDGPRRPVGESLIFHPSSHER